MDAVMLKPLPYRGANRIVTLSTADKADRTRTSYVSAPDFRDWHDRSASFDALAYYKAEETAVTVGAAADYARVARISPEFFRVFAVDPLAGRPFTPEETNAGGSGAILLSHAYWQSRLGGRNDAVGLTIRAYGRALPVVGILPPGFQFPDKTDLWIPTNTVVPDRETRGGLNRQAVGRIKQGISLDQAQSEMSVIAERLAREYPKSDEGRTIAVVPLRNDLVRNVALTLYLLLGAVALVLLIACVNVATLLLGKAAVRTREIAIRASMGAGRGRIVRQLLTESVVLAILAGAAGMLFAYGGSRALVALAPGDVPRLADAGIDWRVLAFTLAVTVLACIVFGVVPALHASRVDLNEALKRGGRAGTSGSTTRIRRGLVVAEVAFSVLLLSGAALLVRSFLTLNRVALGYRPDNVLVVDTSVQTTSTVESQRRATRWYKQSLPELRGVPGVIAAGAMLVPPGRRGPRGNVWGDFLPADAERRAPVAGFSVVAPGTFAALGVPKLSGRDFDDRDTYDGTFTVIVNEALAREAFPGQVPLGRTIFCGLDDARRPLQIIGVVADFRQYGPATEPSPEIYLPYEQHLNNATSLRLIVRTSRPPQSFAGVLRSKLRAESPDVPLTFTTMETLLDQDLAAPRFRTVLLAIFAGLAVCLAMAGVYGVLAYFVALRSSEIGLRMALGADRRNVLTLVVRQGVALAALGLTLGLAGSIATNRMLAGFLFEVKPGDPLAYASVAGFLALATFAASYLPARRAVAIDPLRALRQD
jgi:predicted permease